MSKETVKVYSHDGANITIAEIPKEDIDRILGKYFTDYDECKEDLELEQKIKRVIKRSQHENYINNISDKVDQLEKDVTRVGDRVADLRDSTDKVVGDIGSEIDRVEKECERGQDMLLDRIKELESELEPKEEEKVKKELNVFEIILAIGIGWIIGFGLFHLVN